MAYCGILGLDPALDMALHLVVPWAGLRPAAVHRALVAEPFEGGHSGARGLSEPRKREAVHTRQKHVGAPTEEGAKVRSPEPNLAGVLLQ